MPLKPGLTGRACAVDETADRTAARRRGGGKRGRARSKWRLRRSRCSPTTPQSFDVVVVNHLLPELAEERRLAALAEAARVLRAGGRCVVVQAARRGGLAGLFARSAHMPASEVEAVLQAAGFRAVRTLAEREGLVFVEGARR